MKENKSYWKSTYTGDCYEMDADWEPAFGGWEKIDKETYDAFITKFNSRLYK